MSVEIKNNNTDKVVSAIDKAIERGLEAIGLTAEKYAKEETPVVTGRLRNSISHAVKDDSAYIGSNVEYAPFVELGARGRTGKHMLKRGATEQKDEYKKLMDDSLKNA